MARVTARLRAKSRTGGGKAKSMATRKMPQAKLSAASSGKMVKGISTRTVQTQAKNDWHGKPDTGPKVPK